LWSHDEQGDYVYKWLLTRVTDTHANSITYSYQIETVPGTIYNPTSFLQSISWGYDGPNATGTAHYQVYFTVASRWAALPAGGSTAAADINWDYPYAPVETWKAVTPHEAYRLDAIDVKSWPSGASDYQLIGRYTLNYTDTL